MARQQQQQTAAHQAPPAQARTAGAGSPPQFPAATTELWPPAAERALIGKSIKRLDGPDKAQGSAKYTYDIIRPGMLYARLLGSPHAHARVRASICPPPRSCRA